MGFTEVSRLFFCFLKRSHRSGSTDIPEPHPGIYSVDATPLLQGEGKRRGVSRFYDIFGLFARKGNTSVAIGFNQWMGQ
jgi:hypothetical protein